MKPRFTLLSMVLLLVPIALLASVSLPAHAQKFTDLYNFTGGSDGGGPYGGVIRDKTGTLYGTTRAGGDSNDGTVWKLSKGTETVLHSFSGSDGSAPFATLATDASGNLYGTASTGGSSGYGTVFKLSSSGKFSTLYTFTGSSDGANPYSGLILDKNGNLYGTTAAGGTSGVGTVFKVNIKSKKETVLHSFAGGSDGAYPYYGNLLLDSKGNLYGNATIGGSSNDGVVWEITAKGKEIILHSFTGGSDGADPFEHSLAMDTKGNLYGTTEEGGANSLGIVFMVNIKSKKETVLYTFTGGSDGGEPSAGLVRASNGTLYGTTQVGGANSAGVVFQLIGKKETVLHTFDGTDGSNPFAAPLLYVKGTLYGVTDFGGADGDGVVFSLKP